MIQNKSTKRLWLNLVFILALFAVLILMCNYALRTLAFSVLGSNCQYFLILLLFVINIYIAVQSKQGFLLYAGMLFLLFAGYSIIDRAYSPIDEYANFDYINWLIREGTLPTFSDMLDGKYLSEATAGLHSIYNGTNHEVVQAPLYYILFALVGRFFPGAYIRLRVFRLLSLGSVFIIWYFLNKTIRYLESKEIIHCNEKVYRLSLLLTIFNPAYLHRASRLNNEVLVCILMVVLLYVAVKCLTEGYSKKYYWLLSFLCVSLFMTKNTAVYAYVLFGAIVLYQRKLPQAIIPGITGVALTVPWFLFNINTYGSLTAMEEHLAYAIPIVNPALLPVDLFDAFFSILPITYFSAEEIRFPMADSFFIMLGFAGILVCVMEAVRSVCTKANIKTVIKGEKLEHCTEIKAACIILLLSAVLCLLAGTLSTKICSIRGRYLYGPCIVLVLLLQIKDNCLSAGQKRWLALFFVAAIAVASARFTITYADMYFSNEQLFGRNVEQIECEDITDESWVHGVMRNGQVVVVNNDGRNFAALKNRQVRIADEDCVIEEIQYHGQYLWLVLNRAINISRVENNLVFVGDPAEKIAFGVSETIIPDVNGVQVMQEVRLQENRRIIGFSAMYGTYLNPEYDSNIRYTVTDAKGNILTEGTAAFDNMVDNAYVTVHFEQVVAVMPEEMIRICFTLEGDAGKPIALYASEDNSSIDGNLYLGEELVPELDVSLVLIADTQ